MRAEEFVQVLIPGFVYFEFRVIPASIPLVPLTDFPWQGSAYHNWIRSKCKRQTNDLLQARSPPGHYDSILG
jgi:hypothetical protein